MDDHTEYTDGAWAPVPDDKSIRLACLKLARPDQTINPDAQQIIDRAEMFFKFVVRETYSTTLSTFTKADTAQAPAPSLSTGRRPRQGK